MDRAHRLGARRGVDDVMQHPWFSSPNGPLVQYDWAELTSSAAAGKPAPFKPVKTGKVEKIKMIVRAKILHKVGSGGNNDLLHIPHHHDHYNKHNNKKSDEKNASGQELVLLADISATDLRQQHANKVSTKSMDFDDRLFDRFDGVYVRPSRRPSIDPFAAANAANSAAACSC